MTTRHAGYLVTLESNLREDDSVATLAALRQIKHVLSVTPVEATADTVIAERIAEQRAMHKVTERIREFLRLP